MMKLALFRVGQTGLIRKNIHQRMKVPPLPG